MNSFTSDSNYKKNIIFLFLLILFLYPILNIFSFLVDDYLQTLRAHRCLFGGNTAGRYNLGKQLYRDTNPDIVFIGNSMTLMHVDTNLFYEMGIKTFNYASSGYFIGQYPDMILNAIKYKPKIIAISIRVDDFFKPTQYYYRHYFHQQDISLNNLSYIKKHVKNPEQWYLLMSFFISYLKSCNYFLVNGYAVSKNIHSIYEQTMGISSIFRFWRTILVLMDEGSNFKKALADKVLSVIRPSLIMLNCRYDKLGNQFPQGCINGDVIMVGTRNKEDFEHYKKKKYLENYNIFLIELFNHFFDEISKAGIKPVLILLPSFYDFVISDATFYGQLHANIIDLSNTNFPLENFADNAHFNTLGRSHYSILLSAKLKNILKT